MLETSGAKRFGEILREMWFGWREVGSLFLVMRKFSPEIG